MKIFLSTPFSSRVDSDGSVIPEFRQSIEQLLIDLRAVGHQVFSALEYTNWKIGENVAPDEEFRIDLREIDTSDKVICLLEERVSAGVQLELGYAYAKGKQLEIYQIGKSAWSNLAFSAAVGCGLEPVENIDDFVTKAIKNNPTSA